MSMFSCSTGKMSGCRVMCEIDDRVRIVASSQAFQYAQCVGAMGNLQQSQDLVLMVAPLLQHTISTFPEKSMMGINSFREDADGTT